MLTDFRTLPPHAKLRDGVELLLAGVQQDFPVLERLRPFVKPEAKETGSFNSTSDEIPQLGKEPSLKKFIFDLKAPGVIDSVLPVGETLVVAVVSERKSPSDPDFETQKVQLKTEAVKGKQFEIRESFLKSLKQSGTVVTNDSAIDKVIGDS